MKRNWVIWGMGAVGVFIVLLLVWAHLSASADKADLDHELDVARKEGLPTTWREYAALIKSAKPEENAAPFYRKLIRLSKDKANLSKLDSDLLLRPSAEHVALATSELAAQSEAIAAIDQAARLPRCWFNRDWSKGLAVLMPEYAWMKAGGRLVALRGSLAASDGHPAEAIKNVQELFHVAKHAGEEGTEISFLIQDSIFVIGIRHLALWFFIHPSESSYRKALDDALNSWPKPDLRRLHRSDLLELREVLEDSTTEKGRKDLGLKEEDIPKMEPFVPLIVSRPKANIKLARAMRQIWEALGDSPGNRLWRIDAGWNDLLPAMAAYPTGSDIYMKLTDSGGRDHFRSLYDQVWACRRLSYLALARALSGTSTPKHIDTEGLLSPFDGKPVDYSFDGHQITINVSSPDKSIDIPTLKFPSESELAPDKR